MSILLMFWFLLVTNDLEAAKVPVCRGIEHSGIIQDSSGNDNNIATFNFNIDVTFDEKNLTFPNTLFVTNFTVWNLYEGFVYTRTGAIYDYNLVENILMINTTKTFKFSLQNIVVSFVQLFGNGLSDDQITEGFALFIKNGYIFDADSGNFMNEENDFSLKRIYYCGALHNCNETIRCTNIEYKEIQDYEEEICETFETNAVVPTQDLNFVKLNYSFHAIYHVTPKNLEISIIANTDIQFIFNPLNIFYYDCGNYYQPLITNFNCTASFPISDFQWEMNLNVEPNRTLFIVGELARWNGTFFYNVNIPFTSKEPCLNYSKTDYTASFCCTSFSNPEKITTANFETSTKDFTQTTTTTLSNIVTTTTSTRTKTPSITTSVNKNNARRTRMILMDFIIITTVILLLF